jgi:peptidoglycan/LPS O-acetylase OafA/YrhL
MTDKRLLGADFLRAAACIMVVMHHLAYRIGLDNAPALARPFLEFGRTGSFGVAIFFVLSGYLLARPFWIALDAGKAMPDLRVYGLRRAARILPGFWLALTVSFVLSFAVGGSVLDGTLAGRYLTGMLLISDWHWLTLFPVDNNGPLWSIGFEITSYVLLPVCLAMLFALKGGAAGRLARLAWVAIIALVLVVHAGIVAFTPTEEIGRGWPHGLIGGAKAWVPMFNPVGFFAIFAIGALAAGVQVRLGAYRSAWFDMAGLAAIGAIFWVMAAYVDVPSEGFGWLAVPYGFPWVPIAAAVALCALPSSVIAGRLLDNGVARFIARISFGIYIWHFLIIELMEQLAPPSFQGSGPEGWRIWLVSSAVACILSTLVATLSFYALEQPIIRYARSREDKFAPAEHRAGKRAEDQPARVKALK